MLFSIIILNWNGKKWLKNCLDSIVAQKFRDYEIIFADNDSTDGSVEYVKKTYPAVTVVETGCNAGYAAGNNAASHAANGEWLFFLNNDAMLKEDCLLRLYEAVNAGSAQIGIWALRIFSYDGLRDLYEGDRWMGVDFLGYPFLGNKLFYADGAALVIRRDLFIPLGGFDEKHYMYAEDIDLCWRARLLGYTVAGARNAVIFHAVGASMIGEPCAKHTTSLRKRYMAEKNTIRNLIKNYSGLTLIWAIPFLLFVYVCEMFLCALLLRFDMITGVYLKAVWHNLSAMGDTFRERRNVQGLRTVPDREIIKAMSLKLSKIEVLMKVGVPLLRERQ